MTISFAAETITVYTKSNCIQCTMTKRFLDKAGADYEVVDIESDEAALEFVKGLGIASAPAVIAGDTAFGGFQPERLKLLV